MRGEFILNDLGRPTVITRVLIAVQESQSQRREDDITRGQNDVVISQGLRTALDVEKARTGSPLEPSEEMCSGDTLILDL